MTVSGALRVWRCYWVLLWPPLRRAMVMAGTGITDTIGLSRKIVRSSRSKPLLSRHLSVMVTSLL